MPPAGAIAGADAASAPQAQQVWELRESDGSVRNALQRWAREAGWQFVWDVPTDFTVDANATIHGSLDEALREVVDALSNAQVPIQIVMYKGNRVLRVIPKGAG
ncbi:MAG TPA: toxin co-regulated pilus biosynthesis Q family protein [Paraburkholderia sp.]|nr:toxin co-regulated pilus biosynthesis Q family protein [Paraburkholderia sp.]